ncbi:MAG: Spore coat associated protein JA (CotJA) [Firmicutes bacterium ADurb.Bin182]|nr:MAG: Spore coat associated protein JA (CotJA) [Firmicutes bacterium ADurb.Bin182]
MYKRPNAHPSCGGVCCIEGHGEGINPLSVANTVPAGSAYEDLCDEEDVLGEEYEDCLLATAYMPFQDYRAGFCPDEALEHGTLFPELVRPYR